MHAFQKDTSTEKLQFASMYVSGLQIKMKYVCVETTISYLN
jgi:hypothetical protein